MIRILIAVSLLMIAPHSEAGDRVAGTNFYVVKSEEIDAGAEVFWSEDNIGNYTISEGPIASGLVRCVGSGFGGPGGVNGGGVCVYGEGGDTYTMKWKVETFGRNSWTIVAATGKYAGMTGSGTTKTRVTSKFLKLSHRISDWEGEIELPRVD